MGTNYHKKPMISSIGKNAPKCAFKNGLAIGARARNVRAPLKCFYTQFSRTLKNAPSTEYHTLCLSIFTALRLNKHFITCGIYCIQYNPKKIPKNPLHLYSSSTLRVVKKRAPIIQILGMVKKQAYNDIIIKSLLNGLIVCYNCVEHSH